MGRIRNRKELGVLYLSPSDLQLCSPEFSLRAPDMADIPVFTTKNGRGMQWLTPAGDPPITVPINSGAEIFDLYREVSRYLLEQGRIEDGDDISIRKLSADAWARAQVTLEPQGKQVLCYEAEVEGRLRCWQVPVFTNGHDLIAARTNRLGRVTLYFGPDLWALQRRLAEDLYTGGTISSPGSVRVVTVQAPDAGAETAQRPVSLLDSVLQNGFFGEKSLKAQC
jgi:hypothetical protein